MLDEAWLPRRLYYNKSSILRRLEAPAIDVLLAFGGAMPTPLSAIALQQLHGAAIRVAPDATAFPYRFEDASKGAKPRIRNAYGANYARLVALKKQFDPTNVLSSNANLAT